MTFGVPGRALRGRPGHRQGARPAAHPARRPRAELLHLDRAARRLRRRPTSSPRSPPASTPCPARCTAAPTRPSSRCSTSIQRVGDDVDEVHGARSRTRRTASGSWASGTGSTRTTTRARRSSSRPPTTSSRTLGVHDPLLDIAKRSRRSRSPTTTSSSASSTRTSTSTPASSTRRWASRRAMFTVLFAIGRLPGLDRPVARDRRGPADEDRPSPPDLRRVDRAQVPSAVRALSPGPRRPRTALSRESAVPRAPEAHFPAKVRSRAQGGLLRLAGGHDDDRRALRRPAACGSALEGLPAGVGG